MLSSFYLGSILRCECLVNLLFGTPSTNQASNDSSEVRIKMTEFNSKKAASSKRYLDPLAASSKISIGNLLLTQSIDEKNETVSGEGRVYGLLPISQSKLYFEVHIIRVGELRVGVGWKEKDHLDEPLNNSKAWTAEFSSFENPIEAGDVIVNQIINT